MNYILQHHFKKNQRGMMRKLNVTLGQSQETSCTAITLNGESKCTGREKNHFPFRKSTQTTPGQHVHHWTYCWKNSLKITGTWMEKKNCQIRGQASQDSFYRTEGHLTDIHRPG